LKTVPTKRFLRVSPPADFRPPSLLPPLLSLPFFFLREMLEEYSRLWSRDGFSKIPPGRPPPEEFFPPFSFFFLSFSAKQDVSTLSGAPYGYRYVRKSDAASVLLFFSFPFFPPFNLENRSNRRKPQRPGRSTHSLEFPVAPLPLFFSFFLKLKGHTAKDQQPLRQKGGFSPRPVPPSPLPPFFFFFFPMIYLYGQERLVETERFSLRPPSSLFPPFLGYIGIRPKTTRADSILSVLGFDRYPFLFPLPPPPFFFFMTRRT